MPFGCGEQNMLNFVPNVVILNYLRVGNTIVLKCFEIMVPYIIRMYDLYVLGFLVSNLYVSYVQSVRQLTPSIEAKAIKHLETGYQQELTFRRTDGSFSAFGGADSVGSTW